MGMFDKLIANLKASKKTIVFTEGTDARILSAADRLLKECRKQAGDYKSRM